MCRHASTRRQLYLAAHTLTLLPLPSSTHAVQVAVAVAVKVHVHIHQFRAGVVLGRLDVDVDRGALLVEGDAFRDVIGVRFGRPSIGLDERLSVFALGAVDALFGLLEDLAHAGFVFGDRGLALLDLCVSDGFVAVVSVDEWAPGRSSQGSLGIAAGRCCTQ